MKKVLILVIILMSFLLSEEDKLDISKFLRDITHTKIYIYDAKVGFEESSWKENNCIFYKRTFESFYLPNMELGKVYSESELNSMKKTNLIEDSFHNLKICDENGSLYLYEDLSQNEKIKILGEATSWLNIHSTVDGKNYSYKCNRKKIEYVFNNKKNEALQVTCDTGKYYIFIKYIGIVEEGIMNKEVTYKLKKIK